MIAFARNIGLFQVGTTPDVLRCHYFHQAHHLADEIIAFAIQVMEQRMDGVEIGAQPRVEVTQVAFADVGLELVEDLVQ